jgi:hypothetical protein
MNQGEREIVQPLEVVDREQRRLLRCKCLMGGLENADGLDRGPGLALKKLPKGTSVVSRTQLPKERCDGGERYLSFDLVARHAKAPSRAELLSGCCHQSRLPDARITEQNDRSRPFGPREAGIDLRQLSLPANEPRGHAASLRRLRQKRNDPKLAQAAAFADCARGGHRTQTLDRLVGNAPVVVCVPVDNGGAARIMLPHVVVVDRLLTEVPTLDACVDSRGCCVGVAKERLAVDLAERDSAGFDDWVRPYHLQVEDESAWPDRLDHMTQDVHDVLALNSSERPGEEREVERATIDLDRAAGGDAIVNPIGEIGRKGGPRTLDRVGVGIERQHVVGIRGDRNREAAVATAELEHAQSAEVGEPVERREMGALGIELARQGLYALRVVPRAPNFSAFWRVSSNFERAYVSTS